MLSWDDEKGILYAYKYEIARPSLWPESSNSAYASFQKYIEKDIKNDVTEFFIPGIVDCLKNVGGISVDPEDIRITDVGMKTYFSDESKLVQVKFRVPKADAEPEWVTIMRIPTVGEDNIVRANGHEYAFINIIEQEPSISYEEKGKSMCLKLLNGLQNIVLRQTGGENCVIEFSDLKSKSSSKKYDPLSLIFAMARYEGFNQRDLFKEFSSYSITKEGDGNKVNVLEQRMATLVGSPTIKAVEYDSLLIPRLKLFEDLEGRNRNRVDSYNNSNIRPRLNNLLSLKMAKGRTLAKDVPSVLNPSEKPVAYAGDIITDQILSDFSTNGVYKVDVKIDPQIEGHFLAQNTYVFKLYRGLRMSDLVRTVVPDEKGMYLSRDYDYKEFLYGAPLVIPAGTEITKDIINVLTNYGIDEIEIKSKQQGGGPSHTYRFYEEVISNRQFERVHDGVKAWYYLDSSNNLVPNDGTYTTYDFVALLSYVTKLFSGRYQDRIVDADKGFRKRLVTLAEQYHKAFRYSCSVSFRMIRQTLLQVYKGDKTKFMQADAMENRFYPFQKFFFKYLKDNVRCLEMLQGDNICNPIAYISACTKANVFVKSKHAVADAQRDIAIGSYGKLDPYEVPQSGKLGVANHICCGTNVVEEDIKLKDGTIIEAGAMRTAYYKLLHKVSEKTGTTIDTSKRVYMTAEEEEKFVIADICSIEFTPDGKSVDNTKLVLCRVPNDSFNEKSTFAYKHIYEIDYVNCDAEQSLSWASATVPFIASNDAARAVFAVAQMKQAKGLINPEEPDVLTSAWEQIPRLNNRFGFIAKKAGTVVEYNYDRRAKKHRLDVRYVDGTEENIVYPVFLNSGISVTKFNILVDKDDEFNAGDVLVSSNFVSNKGVMTLGVNALVGYICDGWNYEDGAHISEALSSKMSSYRINAESIEGNQESDYAYTVTSDIKNGYIQKGTYNVPVNFKRSSKRGPVSQSKEHLVTKAYGFYESQDPIHKKEYKGTGRVVGVKLNFVSVDKFGVGDKISNRHGNKGVLSVVSPTAEMPRLANGMALELCLNPTGVGSRMNIGQIKELHGGLVSHVGGYQLSPDAYNSISEDELKLLLSLTYDLANSTGNADSILNSYDNKLFNVIPYGNLFKARLRRNINQIRLYAGCFERDGTAYVELPTNDGKLTRTRIPVGYLYVYKLTQEVEEKFHVRGGLNDFAPYTRRADAPTEGASAGGGQRMGTMEIDALCAYGASNYIHELTNERSDNALARNDFIIDTFLPKGVRDTYKRKPEFAQRRSVTEFLYSMLSLGVMLEPTDNEFVNLNKYNSEDCAPVKPKYLRAAGTKLDRQFGSDYIDRVDLGELESKPVVNSTSDTKLVTPAEVEAEEQHEFEDTEKKSMTLLEAAAEVGNGDLKYALLRKKE